MPIGHPHLGTPFTMLHVADLAHMACSQVRGALPRAAVVSAARRARRHAEKNQNYREPTEHQAGYVVIAIDFLELSAVDALRPSDRRWRRHEHGVLANGAVSDCDRG